MIDLLDEERFLFETLGLLLDGVAMELLRVLVVDSRFFGFFVDGLFVETDIFLDLLEDLARLGCHCLFLLLIPGLLLRKLLQLFLCVGPRGPFLRLLVVVIDFASI